MVKMVEAFMMVEKLGRHSPIFYRVQAEELLNAIGEALIGAAATGSDFHPSDVLQRSGGA